MVTLPPGPLEGALMRTVGQLEGIFLLLVLAEGRATSGESRKTPLVTLDRTPTEGVKGHGFRWVNPSGPQRVATE